MECSDGQLPDSFGTLLVRRISPRPPPPRVVFRLLLNMVALATCLSGQVHLISSHSGSLEASKSLLPDHRPSQHLDAEAHR